MAEVAKNEMMEETRAAARDIPVRRFNTPDIRDKAMWLIPRLKAAFPDKQDGYLIGWLGQLSNSVEYMILNTSNAVGACQRVFDGLNAKPTLVELFVFTRPVPSGKDADALKRSYIEEAAAMYPVMADWGYNLGASEFVVDRISAAEIKLTDVPKNMIQDQIGKLLARQTVYAKIDRT